MYDDYLAEFGIQSFHPPQILRAHTDAQKLTSSDVESMTHKALAEFPGIDAIYFQGALLDPIPLLDKLEGELSLPIVASNPAMLWLVLSKLGRRYQIPGYGNIVIVAHDGGLSSVYAHNARNEVSQGDFVRQGEAVSRVGRTGRTTGANLHFEIRSQNIARNPLFYLPPWPGNQGIRESAE